MVSRIAFLIVGLLVGYSTAYFHFSVDPGAFQVAQDSTTSGKSTGPNQSTKSTSRNISTIEQELNKYVAQGEWKEIISLGKAGIKIQPDYKDALAPIMKNAFIKLASQAYENGDHNETVQLLNESQKYSTLNGKELLTLSQSHLSLNAFEKAKNSLKKAEKLSDSPSEAIQAIKRKIIDKELRTLIEQKNINAAIHLLELELIGDSSYSRYYLKLAELNYRQTEFQKTLNNFDAAQQLGEQLNSDQQKLYKKAKRRSETPNLIEVPLKIENNNLFVNATINQSSTPYRFLIDTGATFTSLSSQTAESLGISPSSEQDLDMITVVTANGPVSASKLVLDNVMVAEANVDDVEAIILDSLGSEIDGLLGLSFLQQFRVEIVSDESLLILKPL